MSLLAGQHQPPDPGADTAGLSAFKAVGSQLAVSAGQSIFMFSMSATNNTTDANKQSFYVLHVSRNVSTVY